VGRQSDKRSIKSNFILISLLLLVVASLSFVSVYDLIFLDLGGRKKKKKTSRRNAAGWPLSSTFISRRIIICKRGPIKR
jgi:hypothetical protein